MKKIFLYFLVSSSFFSYAQNSLVPQWDNRFGGTDYEWLLQIKQTTDSGYLLAGNSTSGISGDKTQPSQGDWDYWIVKINSLGVKLWDKSFGSTNYDQLNALIVCQDKGVLIGGSSVGNVSGDKSMPSQGGYDFWIVKTDSLGNKLWDWDFGGAGDDYLISIQQTEDKGFILGGYSSSGISGDKTQPSRGGEDYWIIKTDSLGNKQWDKSFGGVSFDDLFCLKQTKDEGYILAGSSFSGISGDKTQPLQGFNDYWIIKIDSLGNQLWDKDFGSANEDDLYSIEIDIYGGYILGGHSPQGISGDKTQGGWGGLDFWIVKTDSLGNKQWDKTYGGTFDEDDFNEIEKTIDGGYLLAGASYSPISGDKSENNLGAEQSWIIKIDQLGNKEWDKTLLTNCGIIHDEAGYAFQSNDGCYVMGNYTFAGIGGDKTQSSQGGDDYWIIKFCDTTSTPIVAFTTGTPLCPGTCTSFTNLSTNATSYQWFFSSAMPDTSTAVNPQNICYNTPGSYDVTLIATNANGSDTLTLANYITVFPYPPAQGITQSGDTLFANQGAVSYQWYFNGNIITSATNYFYVALASGDYNVVCTDANGCEVEAVIFNVVATIDSPSKDGLADANSGMQVFPNPAEDKLEVGAQVLGRSTPQGVLRTVEISIYNVIGVLVFQSATTHSSPGNQNTDSKISIDVHALSPGIYWLEIGNEEKVLRSKFVKQ